MKPLFSEDWVWSWKCILWKEINESLKKGIWLRKISGSNPFLEMDRLRQIGFQRRLATWLVINSNGPFLWHLEGYIKEHM